MSGDRAFRRDNLSDPQLFKGRLSRNAKPRPPGFLAHDALSSLLTQGCGVESSDWRKSCEPDSARGIKLGSRSRRPRSRTPALPFCHRTLKAAVPKPGYPKQFSHLGHHVRARRIDLGLQLEPAASRMGVASDTLRNWESGRTEPEVRFLPALIEFLGYDPLPLPKTAGQAIRKARLSFGLSLKGVAARARVDEASVRRLEADTTGMARRVRYAVRMALGLGEDQPQPPRAPACG